MTISQVIKLSVSVVAILLVASCDSQSKKDWGAKSAQIVKDFPALSRSRDPMYSAGVLVYSAAPNRDFQRREIYTNAGGQTQRLTNNEVDDYDPAWSPDGEKIIYISDKQLFVMQKDGSNKIRLNGDREECAGMPRVSQRGLVAYLSSEFQPYLQRPVDLVVTDGKQFKTATATVPEKYRGTHLDFQLVLKRPKVPITDFAWSPDGHTLLYATRQLLGFYEFDSDAAVLVPFDEIATRLNGGYPDRIAWSDSGQSAVIHVELPRPDKFREVNTYESWILLSPAFLTSHDRAGITVESSPD